MLFRSSIASSCQWRFEPCAVIGHRASRFRNGAAEGNENLALKALAAGRGLNVGKAVMAGLVPAIHAAPLISVSSDAYDEAAVFSWMVGSSPAMTGEPESQPHPHI